MSKPEFLDNVTHHDVRVITRYGAEFGDNVNQALVYPTEFLDLQREYAIFFRKTDKGGLQSVAILGLDSQENLYLDGDRWNARYVPAMHQRGPCLTGYRDVEANGDVRREPALMIDMDNPRVSRSEGAPLFLPQGGNAPQQERIAKALRTLNQGAALSDRMVSAFADARLLAPATMTLRLDDTTAYTLPDLFTISGQGMAELDGPTLQKLNNEGFLALAFHVVASVGNLHRLMDIKNRRRAA